MKLRALMYAATKWHQQTPRCQLFTMAVPTELEEEFSFKKHSCVYSLTFDTYIHNNKIYIFALSFWVFRFLCFFIYYFEIY